MMEDDDDEDEDDEDFVPDLFTLDDESMSDKLFVRSHPTVSKSEILDLLEDSRRLLRMGEMGPEYPGLVMPGQETPVSPMRMAGGNAGIVSGVSSGGFTGIAGMEAAASLEQIGCGIAGSDVGEDKVPQSVLDRQRQLFELYYRPAEDDISSLDIDTSVAAGAVPGVGVSAKALERAQELQAIVWRQLRDVTTLFYQLCFLARFTNDRRFVVQNGKETVSDRRAAEATYLFSSLSECEGHSLQQLGRLSFLQTFHCRRLARAACERLAACGSREQYPVVQSVWSIPGLNPDQYQSLLLVSASSAKADQMTAGAKDGAGEASALQSGTLRRNRQTVGKETDLRVHIANDIARRVSVVMGSLDNRLLLSPEAYREAVRGFIRRRTEQSRFSRVENILLLRGLILDGLHLTKLSKEHVILRTERQISNYMKNQSSGRKANSEWNTPFRIWRRYFSGKLSANQERKLLLSVHGPGCDWKELMVASFPFLRDPSVLRARYGDLISFRELYWQLRFYEASNNHVDPAGRTAAIEECNLFDAPDEEMDDIDEVREAAGYRSSTRRGIEGDDVSEEEVFEEDDLEQGAAWNEWPRSFATTDRSGPRKRQRNSVDSDDNCSAAEDNLEDDEQFEEHVLDE
jgi:hypothetical protein